MLKPDVPNEIQLYFHCGRCLAEKPSDVSPREWGQLEAGWTKHGFQVWCKRHEVNVVHIDFEGQKHPIIDVPRVANDRSRP